jgi:glutaconate CoA-transferase subunit A
VQDKRATLAEAARLVRDGDVVALQNMATQSAPMALVRELIRQERRGLGLVVLVGGIGVDWLAAAGAIDRLIGAAVTMEQFGLCRRYRASVEAGRIRVEELSESLLNARLGAGARQLPFLPSRGAIGSDLIARNPGNLRLIEDPFGGRPVVACRALVPDVALVHAHRADCSGNVQYDPTAMWPDLAAMPYAARRVIVTAEEIVDSELLRRHPERTVLPGFIVDAVVEAPCGAHPTSFFPAYGYDAEFHREWARAAAEDETAQRFLDHHVRGPASQAEYLLAAGGEAMLARIREEVA